MASNASVQRGTNWVQMCDSEGPHNPAVLTYDNFLGTRMVWTPTHRDSGWDNIFMYVKQFTTDKAKNFALDVDMRLEDAQSLDSINCLEFQVEWVFSHKKYNMAWQVKKTSSNLVLSTFDFGNTWIDTGLRRPLSDFTVGKFSKWTALFSIDINFIPLGFNGPHHLGLYCNGVFLPVDIKRNAVQTNSADYKSFAIQFDGSNVERTITSTFDVKLSKF